MILLFYLSVLSTLSHQKLFELDQTVLVELGESWPFNYFHKSIIQHFLHYCLEPSKPIFICAIIVVY